MRKIAIAGLAAAAAVAGVAVMRARREPHEMPEPTKEHDWLEKMAGEWESDVEMYMEPGQPPVRHQGKQRARMIGGYWLVAEDRGSFMGKPFVGIMSLGYDTSLQKYVGTWVGSIMSHLWMYEGEVNSSGKVLRLETEGPCPLDPDRLFKFRESFEIKSRDHKVYTSEMLSDDGQWTPVMTVDYRRTK